MEDDFKVRLNCIDSYQSTPTKYDPQLRRALRPEQLSKQPKVPVIRVFGSTETGQKVCAHVHGAFPYLYIEYQGSLATQDVGSYILSLHQSIDYALALSYRRDRGSNNAKFVARITVVKGIPFFGFHVGYRYYLKIYILNPMVMTRLADLLHQGLVMDRKFQPYEAHLSHLLQFMIDYNLYGCHYIKATKVRFRAPVPDHPLEKNSRKSWHSQSIDRRLITDDPGLPRLSHCSIEVDICVQDIANRLDIKERKLHHDFVEMMDPLPTDAKWVPSMEGLWKDETKRRKRRLGNSAPGSSPFPPEALVPMSASMRKSQLSGWIHEDGFRDDLQRLAQKELGEKNSLPTLDTIARPHPSDSTIKTAWESVEDLYPDNLARSMGLVQDPVGDVIAPPCSIAVDEKGIIDFSQRGEAVSDEMAQTVLQEAESAMTPVKPKNAVGRVVNKSGMPKLVLKGNKIPPVPTYSPESREDVGSLGGVRQSSLATGNSPQFPVSEALTTFIEAGYWCLDIDDLGVEQKVSAKRKESSVAHDFDLKRVKIDNDSSGTLVAKTLGLISEASKSNTRRTHATNSLPRKVQGQDKPSAQTSPALNFSVVKDPNDRYTKLRLSQKTNSQQSEGGEKPGRRQLGDNLSPVKDEPETQVAEKESQKKTVSFVADSFRREDVSSAKISAHQRTSSSSLSSGDSAEQYLRAARKAISSSAISTTSYMAPTLPPALSEILSSMQSNGLPDVVYQDAYYSDPSDLPERLREYAGREFKLESKTLPFLPEFDASGESPAAFGQPFKRGIEPSEYPSNIKANGTECTIRSWEVAVPPPTFDEVKDWWSARVSGNNQGVPDSSSPKMVAASHRFLSQIEGVTQKSKHGFKYSPKRKSTSVQHEAQYMSTMAIEIHVNTRGNYMPHPEHDELRAIFWAVQSDGTRSSSPGKSQSRQQGIAVLSEDGYLASKIRKQTPGVEVMEEPTELDLFSCLISLVREHDPDILTGYEVHGSSWGFLMERARIKYEYNLCDEISRTKSESFGRIGKESDSWGFNQTSSIHVTGRHVINIWRAMRGELNLLQFTMENVAWHLCHKRIPRYSWQTLTDWFINGRPRDLNKVITYYMTRSAMDLEILETNDLIPRTSEQARLLGVDFYSVFSRGSQFKVESVMFRIAKPESFLLVSPSRKQVGGQNALECLPLVMEPQSQFYSSPLVVLDFQSLYPSVMIAYNYCYSTFLGRITDWRGQNKMGFTTYQRPPGILGLLQDEINISPNGMMFFKPSVRKSLLAKMLTDILETRVMVKSGMKQDKDDGALQQLLNNRQLALKLLANVTYGYTSASFSGRMPCSEIADSIVQTGRETLEKAISYIHSVESWGAEVVYGDTDSVFVYLPGKTRAQAFEIGNAMAEAITRQNPRPMKLKFEKVYHPCVLLAKKRYVGYKYEHPGQVEPEFEAKGIETVRRDGTPAEQKMEEKCLRLLFETQDLSRVKSYFQEQIRKIALGDVSIQDFCFAKEVKLGSYSERGAPPPGALVATKKMLQDERAEPQYGERVPYVVIAGAPGARLMDRCVAPEEVVMDVSMWLDVEYYATKNLIPPLERIFNLVGANVRGWWEEMPKVQRIRRIDPRAPGGGDQGWTATSASSTACSGPGTASPAHHFQATNKEGKTSEKEIASSKIDASASSCCEGSTAADAGTEET
ncbi:DNA polymerase family B [Zalerion maritima]|uniref:DNA polymerase n=1 Tax=Zalerion maritima TaxID=339359 RepID=A0AAD5WNE2_9PEZI|nr:DNA polymerase family B [Zalerion maritima]